MVSVAVAIVVGLISSFVQSLGLTIQRKSHVQEDLLPLPHRRRPIKRPLWLIGFVIYITSNIFSTIFQLDALPIIILAPLGAVSLIFNALLARVILGDTFGKMAVIGTGLVTGGAILIAVFGVVQEEEHGLDELLRLWRRGPFLAFFGIMVAAVICLLIAAHVAAWHVQRQLNSGRIKLPEDNTPPSSQPPSNYASPHSSPAIPFKHTMRAPQSIRRWSAPITSFSTQTADAEQISPLLPSDSKPSAAKAGVRFKSPHNLTIDLPPADPSFALPTEHQQRTLTLSGLAFAAASGTLSGMSLVLAKAAVELLVMTIEHYRTGKGSNQFARPESWFLVLGLALGAVLQLVYLNYSLAFASPALICPLAFCFFNLSSIFDGLMFYDQFGLLKPHQIALVTVGVAVLLLGVWVVALIKPTGEGGGVEVGLWAEDSDSECEYGREADAGESANLLTLDRPTSEEAAFLPSPAPHAQPGHCESPTQMASPQLSSPNLSSGQFSPTRRRSRGPRYGTLMPDYGGSHIAPTGFSIGIGAASPGFVLRSGSQHHAHDGVSHGHGRVHRGRTQSEGQAGILSIMRGNEQEYADVDRRQSEEGGRTEQEIDGVLGRRDDADLERRRSSWWRGLFSSGEGKIRLASDERGGD